MTKYKYVTIISTISKRFDYDHTDKDTYKKETLEFLSHIPKDAYDIEDPLREELARRIKDIDEGREKLVSLDDDFWDEMDAVIESASANR